MAAITKIEFWKDVGFLEGAIEIPALSAADPINPDLTIEPDQPIMPSKERFFSKLKIREYYEEFMEMSYIRLTYEFNTAVNGVTTTKIFYGWVRDVSLESDGDLPVTVIDWHIDEWRTWKSSISFGSGHVKRRPFVDIATTPIQDYQYRYLELDNDDLNVHDLCPRKYWYSGSPPSAERVLWWIIFSFNVTTVVNNTSVTTIRKGAVPVWMPLDFRADGSIEDWQGLYFKVGNNGTEVKGLSYTDVINGKMDEFLGISPDALNGVWLSPFLIPPDSVSGSGDLGSPMIISDYSLGVVQVGNLYGYLNITAYSNRPSKLDYVPFLIIRPNTHEFQPTETERYIITGFDGSKVMDLPYGMVFDRWTIYLVLEADSAALMFSFRNGIEGRTEGTVAVIPLPNLPINSNALSEYVYSGQRDYDREARTIESNSSAWKTSAGGAGSGAMMGAFGPAGLAIGAAGGVSGGLISYGVEMLYQNDEEQRITDRLKARQTSSLILGSDAQIAMMRFKGPELMRLAPDSYSLAQINATRNQFGISVDELMTSCDSLIRTSSPTGYYNIQNLIVNGDVPVSAKRWIREKFKTGVRLV